MVVVMMVVTMGRDDNDARPVSVMMVVMMVVTELHRDLRRLHVAGFRVTPCILRLQRRHRVRHRV